MEGDEAPAPEGVPPPLGATAPPGDADELSGAPRNVKPIRQQATVAVLAASEVDRLWTSAPAMNYSLLRLVCSWGSELCPARAFLELKVAHSAPGEARR